MIKKYIKKILHTLLIIQRFYKMKEYTELTQAERVKQGMAEAKKRGKTFGSPKNLTDESRKKASEVISKKAKTDISVRRAWHFIKPFREEGKTYANIAKMLNDENYLTRTGKKFHAQQVRNIVNRFK